MRGHRLFLCLLGLVLCLALLPCSAHAAQYTAADSLASGAYLLVTEAGWAPAALTCLEDEAPFLTAVQPFSQEVYPLWTLTVTDSGASLLDENGASIAPGGENGIACGEYFWCVTCEGDAFSFTGTSGQTPVVLAWHPETGFRAYAQADVDADPGSYSTRFTLYQETEAEEEVSGWGLYFGQLHSHCAISDGYGTVEEAFAWAAGVEGLDFFALTDHSNSFDNACLGQIGTDAGTVSAEWAAGKAAAEAATTAGFVGIFGYEMSWPGGMGLGHISTFATPGFQSWEQDAYRAHSSGLQNYYETLVSVPDSISQFNHPGILYGDFRNFSFYSEAYDRVITLLEVASGGELPTAYAYYDRALELGWHVAPTNSQNNHRGQWGSADSGRTVVYASSLTEAGIYDALRNYRAYATEDSDLEIYYYLDGHFMGSRLKRQAVGETVHIRVELSDPTDPIGTVEVIAGGTSAARQTLTGCSGTVEFDLPAGCRYYYLRITQPDGDTAVTAPVWVEGDEDAGISDFSCATAMPIQAQAADFSLTLFNNEPGELVLERVEVFADGEAVHTAQDLFTLAQGQAETFCFSLTCDALGQTEVTAVVTASLGGGTRTYRQTLTLSFRRDGMVAELLVDGTHGAVPSLAALTELAAQAQFRVTVETGGITSDMLENAGILLIPAPEAAFEADFLALVEEFVGYGGSVILWGRADATDGDVHAAGELNRLLEAVGSTLRLGDDTVRDDVSNDGENTLLHLSGFHSGAEWCKYVTNDQVYLCADSCTVDPGGGQWLVKGHSTTRADDADGDGLPVGQTVVLAWEQTGAGGHIFAAGSFWLSDSCLAEPKNIWAEPCANRSILRSILGSGGTRLPLSTVAEARAGVLEQVFRVRGYVTAGTANPSNTFPSTIYIQDDTGGIAVAPFTESGISVGTPVEIVGYLKEQDGNRVLHPISWEVLEAAIYRYLPLEGSYELLDNACHGGELVQVEGRVVRLVATGEAGISELILTDGDGNYATVYIEEGIFSGATGRNELADQIRVGRTVRAIGIVHMRGDGVSVVRVRNCDEVVYVPPLSYVWKQAQADNPRVGDAAGLWMIALILSAACLLSMRRKRIM